ncbi:hypothetical protein RRG08_063365 [Elysia crispata]|uniref:Uncharacterized protein n=1 Tax=Elysia crispata TaxID=231223 RepID=A0AAE1B297_9GAST|nr:hypothetical protein RRG08_063365 [Elysia crispata]
MDNYTSSSGKNYYTQKSGKDTDFQRYANMLVLSCCKPIICLDTGQCQSPRNKISSADQLMPATNYHLSSALPPLPSLDVITDVSPGSCTHPLCDYTHSQVAACVLPGATV